MLFSHETTNLYLLTQAIYLSHAVNRDNYRTNKLTSLDPVKLNKLQTLSLASCEIKDRESLEVVNIVIGVKFTICLL